MEEFPFNVDDPLFNPLLSITIRIRIGTVHFSCTLIQVTGSLCGKKIYVLIFMTLANIFHLILTYLCSIFRTL